MFRGRIGTIGLKQVENQMKPNKCDFCTLLIMLHFCTENERNLFSIENRPVGFYTECLLSAGIQSDDVHGNTHGNAKEGSTATEFRPREHSLKGECRTKTAMDTRAPRIIAQESSEKNDLFDSETDCSSVRDSKQITNYR